MKKFILALGVLGMVITGCKKEEIAQPRVEEPSTVVDTVEDEEQEETTEDNNNNQGGTDIGNGDTDTDNGNADTDTDNGDNGDNGNSDNEHVTVCTMTPLNSDIYNKVVSTDDFNIKLSNPSNPSQYIENSEVGSVVNNEFKSTSNGDFELDFNESSVSNNTFTSVDSLVMTLNYNWVSTNVSDAGGSGINENLVVTVTYENGSTENFNFVGNQQTEVYTVSMNVENKVISDFKITVTTEQCSSVRFGNINLKGFEKVCE